MKRFFLLSCLLLLLSSAVGFAGGGSGPDGVDILPDATMPGGGGDGNGVDILPITAPNSISLEFSSGPVRVYHPTGSMNGLVIIVGPTVSTPDGDTISVTITGTADMFGGTPVESQTVDVPDGDRLTFDMTLKKRENKTPPDSCEGSGVEVPRDKREINIDVDTPFSELDDGDNTDDNIGSAYGYNPLLGFGGGPAYG